MLARTLALVGQLDSQKMTMQLVDKRVGLALEEADRGDRCWYGSFVAVEVGRLS